MTELTSLVSDLEAETDSLMSVIGDLTDAEWAKLTPSEPWTVTDQIGHLAYFDETAGLAISDPAAFVDHVNEAFLGVSEDIAELHRQRNLDGPSTRHWFATARRRLLDLAPGLDPETRIPWYGPPMRAASFLVARLMETWAHGTDVADALRTHLPATDRLFHVADLGVRTFSWSFRNRGFDVPDQKVRVELDGPSGSTRTWNDDCADSVTGPLEAFCLVITQRRHVDDTPLRVDGPTARRWMEIAQVFAGPPGPGRPPTAFL